MGRPLSVAVALLLVGTGCSPRPADKTSDAGPAVTVFGGAGRVSGSMYLVEANGHSWVVDVGLFYAEDSSSPDALNDVLPPETARAEAIFLTHTHLDHVGRLPLAIRRGFRGPVYATAATRALMPEMLSQAVRYSNDVRDWQWSRAGSDRHPEYVTAHWHSGCEWARKIAPRNRVGRRGRRSELEAAGGFDLSPCKVCTNLELDPILSSVKTLRYGEPVPLAGNTSAEFLDAGHIPGSASVMFTVQGPASRRLLFAGDLGNQHSDLVDGPKPAPAVNAIWLESTYGSRTRDGNVNEQKATFRRNVGLVTSAGGIAWIPAFALDRTQKILTQLQIARREGDLGALVPIFVGSPSGIAITEAYSSEFSRRSVERWFRPSLYTANQIFPPFTSAQPTPIPKPAVIVTSSGMLDLGLSSTLAHELLPRSDVTVFLVGYQDPASPGAQLQDGVKVVSVDGRTTQVTATVRRFSVFSAHADRADLAAWLANQELTTPVRLVHGDRDNLSALQRNLAASGFTAVQIAGP